ncbi:MAG: hypothetical protein ACRDRH_03240 [Pseudonocardia sp.]
MSAAVSAAFTAVELAPVVLTVLVLIAASVTRSGVAAVVPFGLRGRSAACARRVLGRGERRGPGARAGRCCGPSASLLEVVGSEELLALSPTATIVPRRGVNSRIWPPSSG